jgi:hypothetical protein
MTAGAATPSRPVRISHGFSGESTGWAGGRRVGWKVRVSPCRKAIASSSMTR